MRMYMRLLIGSTEKRKRVNWKLHVIINISVSAINQCHGCHGPKMHFMTEVRLQCRTCSLLSAYEHNEPICTTTVVDNVAVKICSSKLT